MNKNILLLIIILPIFLNAQVGKRIDGIAAVIGDEIVLDSDIDQIYEFNKSTGKEVENKCKFIDNLLMEKLILYKAKQDTLIEIDPDQLNKKIDYTVDGYTKQAGNEGNLLKTFGMQSMAEFRTEIREYLSNTDYTEAKIKSITKGLDVSPDELKIFYNEHKNEFPEVNEEIRISHILLHPELTQEHKDQIIARLNAIKSDIENGADFDEKARIFSEDEGSASKGGAYTKVARGTMVKEFDAVSFNLDEGEISEPFESEFGFHIIKLEKRRGQLLDLRHILIKTEPNKQEIDSAIFQLKKIQNDIKEGKITFKEAVYKYSNDKNTRFNSGVITNDQNGEDRFEKIKLPSSTFFAIAGLGSGDYTEVFEDEYKGKKAVRLILVNEVIPAHKMSLDTDYTRLKNFALNAKKQEVIEDWVKNQIPSTSVVISKLYEDCVYSFDWKQEGDLVMAK